MKKILKWPGMILGTLAVLTILILIIVPMFLDINRYKHIIEEKAANAAGRPFTIGGDIKLSFFPLAGISCSDVHLENPEGFGEKDLVYIKSIELRVKFLPLLFKDIRIKRFIIDSPRITLEKSKDGRLSWQGLGKKEIEATPLKEEKVSEKESGLPVKSLTVSRFAVKEGNLIYIDSTSEIRKEVKDLNIELEDVSLEKPLKLSVSAIADGKPLSIEGTAGPVGKEPGKGTMTVDLAVKTLDTLSMKLQGSVTDAAIKPQFDLNLTIDNFSPRTLIRDLKPDFPLNTKDPAALTAMSASMKIKGTTDNIEISEGAIQLDQSKISISATAKDFSKPDLAFQIKLDKIDADRYLPPAEEKKDQEKPESKTDYASLKKMLVYGDINVGELIIKRMEIKDIKARLKGQKGVFNLDPVSLKAYEGDVTAPVAMDFREDIPVTKADIEIKGVQVRGLISDFMKKDILEGKVYGSVGLSMSGDNAALIKKTLDGKGEVQLKDGAVVGIDLSAMVNNVKAAFGKAQPGAENTGRTDFSEFIIPFEINDGIINTQNTSLVSPVLRVKVKGNADLSMEALDLRVEPTFVKIRKGQRDTKERSGITVPVIVTGTFKEPKFSPDLNGLLQKSLEKGIDRLLKDKTGEDMKPGSTRDAVKGLLKGLLGK